METIKKYSFIIIFLITTYIFFNDQIQGNSWFWEDFTEYVYPIQTFAARESQNFEIPFWNPYSFNGTPFLADLQVGFFYPLHRVLNLFIGVDGKLPVVILELIIILHFLISQITFYLLARFLKISFWGAIIGAIAYSFSLLMVCHTFHPMIVYHLAWFPLIFLFFHKSLTLNSIKSAIYSGLILGIVMLSGHPQTSVYILMFLGIYFIFNISYSYKKLNFKFILNNTSKILILITISLGIFAIQYLPSKDLVELSTRENITFEKASEGSLYFKNYLSAFAPEIFGKVSGDVSQAPSYYLEFPVVNNPKQKAVQIHFYWETAFYFSIVILTLGLFGIYHNYKNKLIVFLIIISLFSILFAAGQNGPFLALIYKIPILGQFRNPGKILFYLIFSFSIFAGFAFDNITKEKNKKIYIFSIAIIGILLLLKSNVFNSILNIPIEISSDIISTINPILIISLVFLIVIYLNQIKIINQNILGLLLATLIFVDLFLAGSDFNRGSRNPQEEYTINPQLESAFKPKLPNDIFRVNTRIYQPSFMAMKRNQGMISQIMLVEGYNPLILKRPIVRISNREKMHDVMNVKYELGLNPINVQPQFVEKFNKFPHFWFVNQYKYINSNDAEDYIKHYNGDLSKEAILENEPNIKLDSNSEIQANARIIEYTNNKIVIEAETNQNSIMVLSEVFYPDWMVKINDKESKIIKADYALRAIELKAGKNNIELFYSSNSFYLGMWITIITLICSVLFLIFYKEKLTANLKLK